MFLKDILAHKSTEKNRFAEGIAAGDAAGMPVPGIWRLFAWKPPLAQALGQLAQVVLRGPSAFSPGFREMIAAFVSTRNRCHF